MEAFVISILVLVHLIPVIIYIGAFKPNKSNHFTESDESNFE